VACVGVFAFSRDRVRRETLELQAEFDRKTAQKV
jgi:hypothetical protein